MIKLNCRPTCGTNTATVIVSAPCFTCPEPAGA